MKKHRLQIIGKNYRAIALDANATADCLSHYLTKRGKLSEDASRQIKEAKAWVRTARLGDVFKKDSYSIRVIDVKSIKDMTAFDLLREVPIFYNRKINQSKHTNYV